MAAAGNSPGHEDLNQNPFVYNKPVRGSDFFNRDDIIKRIMKEILTGKSQGNVWITGERQVGKTSLLNYMYSQLGTYEKKIKLYETDEYLHPAFVFLNTQYKRTRDDFYQLMLENVKTYSDFKLEPKDDAFANFTRAIRYLLEEQKYYFFFLVDEFDALIESMAAADPKATASFLGELNTFMGGTTGIRFSCILTSNHTYDELMNKYEISRFGSGLVMEPVELPWFTGKQVEEMALHYLKNDSHRFTRSESDFCYKMTLGYPYFVQRLFYIMYEQKFRDAETGYSKIAEDYGKAFQETVKGWSMSIPKHTLEKLKGLAVRI